MKTKVFWTGPECKALVDALIKKGIDSTNHHRFLDEMRIIQSEVLESGRERPVRNRMALVCLQEYFEDAKKAAPKPDPIVVQEVEEIASQLESQNNDFVNEVRGGSIDELIDTIAHVAALKFADQFKNALKRIVEDGSHDFVQTLSGNKPKRKRVTVVGLLPQQAGMLGLEYGSRLDCRFLGSDSNVNELRSATNNSDFVLGMVGFMSHSTDGVLAKSESYLRVSGGMSKLRSILDKLV